MQTSGAAGKKAALSSNYYSNMCIAGNSSPCLKEIDQVRV